MQLELPLDRGDQTGFLPKEWSFRVTDEALVETMDGLRIVYGLWDKLFGCWVVDRETEQAREIIPTWCFLGRNGVWRDQWQVRADAHHSGGLEACLDPQIRFSSRWRHQANAAFGAFTASIPYRIRNLVADLKDWQWLALDLIWQKPDFAPFLDEVLFREEQQFIYACFALGRADEMSRADRRKFAESIMSEDREILISRLSGKRCSESFLRAIAKLGPYPAPGKQYHFLLEVCQIRKLAAFLDHQSRIDAAALSRLMDVPREFLRINTMRILFEDSERDDIDMFLYGSGLAEVLGQVHDLCKAAGPEFLQRARDSLRFVRDAEQLRDWANKWESEAVLLVQFPAPPFPGSGALQPLSSFDAMKAESSSMSNCVERLSASVIAGRSYFYHWSGPEPASVMIERSEQGGWKFSTARGVENCPLSTKTIQEIGRGLRPGGSIGFVRYDKKPTSVRD